MSLDLALDFACARFQRQSPLDEESSFVVEEVLDITWWCEVLSVTVSSNNNAQVGLLQGASIVIEWERRLILHWEIY